MRLVLRHPFTRSLPALALLLLLGSGVALSAPRPPRRVRASIAEALARPDTTTAPPLPADAAAQPPLRRPAESRLRELRGQHDFQYVEGKPVNEDSFWDRFLRWLWDKLDVVLGTREGSIAWDTVFYIVVALALVFAVLKLLQVDLTKAFGRSARSLPLPYETGQENIHELDFTEAIAQAEAAGNLRLAVRLGYLQLLKQLTDRNLIDWQPDKTNQTYLRELAESRPAARPSFAELTRQFEYIWYGELPLPAALHQQVREEQRQFGQQLSGAGRRQAA